MQIVEYLEQYTGKTRAELAGLWAVRRDIDRKTGSASHVFTTWNVPGFTAPTSSQIAAAAAAPSPPPAAAHLLTYANEHQSEVLRSVWTVDVGSPSAPLKLTTKLDDAGIRAMHSLGFWGIMNSSSSTAMLDYSNVDLSAASITPGQALLMSQKALAVEAQSIKVLNSVAAAINAAPPTITTTAQVDAAPWPSPGP